MRSVAVYCGSSMGNDPMYADLARTLGGTLAERDMRLVYGGGNVGLMGVVADAVLDAGGSVYGVITRALLDRELGHPGIGQLDITESMHERKAAMESHADAFIALPGGFGTLDELFEIITWSQLGIHSKPIGLLDTEDGFFTHLLAFADDMVARGFVQPTHREMILRDTDAARLLDTLSAWKPVATPKWVTPADVPEP